MSRRPDDLAPAGLEAGEAKPRAFSSPPPVSLQPAVASVDDGGRYEVRRLLGKGAMGEVLRLLAQILTAPQRAVPTAVTAELDAHAVGRHRQQLRMAVVADLSAIVLMTPIVLWMGARSPVLLGVCVALTFAASAAKLVAARMTDLRRMHVVAYVAYVCNVLALLCVGRGFGPLPFMPMLLTAFTFAYCMTYAGAFRAAILTTGVVGLLGSVAVDLSGLVPSSYAFHEGAMTILPRAVTLPELQAWHLKQLLPDEAGTAGTIVER